MLYLNLSRILKLRGIQKPFSYFMSLGYSRNTASKMAQNNVISVTPEKLERYCIELKCTPNDLFEYMPSVKNPLPENHPLLTLQREEKIVEINALLQDLSLEKIRELSDYLQENKPLNP